MNKRTILIISFVLFFVEAVLVYWFGFSTVALREILYLVPPFFAVVSGIVALGTFGFSSVRAKTFLFLTAGMSYWFFGELLFSYYEYIVHVDPYPSAADIFYVLAYPMLFLGLVNELRIAGINWKNIAKPTLFLFVLVALLFAAIIGYFGIFQAYKVEESLLSNIVAISYGIGDLLLILANILLLVLVWEFRGGKLSRVWFLLFCGFIFTLIADILFAIYRNEYTMQLWFYKSLLDSCWMIGYLFIATALFEFSFSIQSIYEKAISQARDSGLHKLPAVTSPSITEQKSTVPTVTTPQENKG